MAAHPPYKTLRALLAEVSSATLVRGDPDAHVRGITHDTRRLESGDLFVAVPGLELDGLRFVPQAIARGAAVVAAESDPGDLGVPVVRVPDARRALAELSAGFFDHPSRSVPVVGITGTDGKTSTTHLLSAILEAHGLRTGWLTTVNTKLGAELRPNPADHTTPEAPLVQRTLAEMRAAGVDVALLEVSSHALELARVHAVHFRIGVFTNLSPEHLNFHGSFEAYRAAKARLFSALPDDGLAVLNADDPASAFMRRMTRARVLTYGLEAASAADIFADEVELAAHGTHFVLRPEGVRVATRLVGRFNVANWLAAYAAATFFGVPPSTLVQAAAQQLPVPGRMNVVNRGQPFSVIVDFAHTPQALEKALDTLRSLGSRRILLVFGMAGGRDAANRPLMGALAADKTDYFVVSTDDPGREDAATIASQIAVGARSHGARLGDDFLIELDRRSAIRTVFERAQPGDAVLIAGKGHERRMVLDTGPIPWNDTEVAGEELERLGYAIQAVP